MCILNKKRITFVLCATSAVKAMDCNILLIYSSSIIKQPFYSPMKSKQEHVFSIFTDSWCTISYLAVRVKYECNVPDYFRKNFSSQSQHGLTFCLCFW